jgi:hypothetical protein
MISQELKLVEFINPPLVNRSRHRTVNVGLREMAHMRIFLRGDWIIVEDPRLDEIHWMPAMSVVRLVPKDPIDELEDIPEEKPRRGRPKKKK